MSSYVRHSAGKHILPKKTIILNIVYIKGQHINADTDVPLLNKYSMSNSTFSR